MTSGGCLWNGIPRLCSLHGPYLKKKTILTDEQRKEIIDLYPRGEYPIIQIAKMYGVERRTISNLLHKIKSQYTENNVPVMTIISIYDFFVAEG